MPSQENIFARLTAALIIVTKYLYCTIILRHRTLPAKGGFFFSGSPTKQTTMSKLNNLAILRRIFDAVPLWPLGASDQKSCLQLLGGALAKASSGEVNGELVHCAVSLADWSWQFYPLAEDLLPLLGFLQESGADFGPASGLVKALAATATQAPNNTSTAMPLEDKLKHLAGTPSLLPKTWEQCRAALLQGDDGPMQEMLRALPAMTGLPHLPCLAARLRAEASLLCPGGHAPETIFDLLGEVDDSLFGAWKTWQTAKLQLQCGDTAAATARLAALAQRYFWHPNLTLIAYDLMHPLPQLPADQRPPAVLLYSWNKCEALRTTLESLRASDIGAAPVFALDNGSTDGTADMLKSMRDSWGTEFKLISLPANVGAPAARNWLLSLPEVRAAEYAAFLDDDVILPQGWLQSLVRVAAAKPKAGSVGCCVTDHIPPFGIQAADFHLLSPAEGLRSFEDMEEHLFPFCQALGQTDTFPLRYTRLCASVTGCCHLLSMRSVADIGAFDVRFNPSQFDDLERDLRLGRHNWEVYFHGPLTVRHMQHSSLRQAMTVQQQAHIMGNRLKLEHLFMPKEAAALQQRTRQSAEEDLLRKYAALAKLPAAAPEPEK